MGVLGQVSDFSPLLSDKSPEYDNSKMGSTLSQIKAVDILWAVEVRWLDPKMVKNHHFSHNIPYNHEK